MKIKVVQ